MSPPIYVYQKELSGARAAFKSTRARTPLKQAFQRVPPSSSYRNYYLLKSSEGNEETRSKDKVALYLDSASCLDYCARFKNRRPGEE